MTDANDSDTAAGGFDPHFVDLDGASLRDVVCYMTQSANEFDGRLGVRVSAIFVLLCTSFSLTLFPVLAARAPRLRIPRHVYLFARYFGAGVIIATAFIHLLDPAYNTIGPASCVGLTGRWAGYSWPPAIAMTSVMLVFLLDFGAEWYVEQKYGFGHVDVEGAVTTTNRPHGAPSPALAVETMKTSKTSTDGDSGPEANAEGKEAPVIRERSQSVSHQFLHSGEQDPVLYRVLVQADTPTEDPHKAKAPKSDVNIESMWGEMAETERAFRQQIVAFLVLEFGVIFHSIIIGLNLGVAGEEFSTLFPVIVFHQAFEGLGIGARLSMIPFPKRYNWLPWTLCLVYGLTTPIAVAIGLGMATTYNPGSFVATVVSGVLDSVSAGILLYTGLVELLARDFLFNPDRSRKKGDLVFMLICLFWGNIVMSLLGKWA